jgi:hypothetical protein
MAQWKITQTIRAANKHLYLHGYLVECSKRRVYWHPLLLIFKTTQVSRKSVHRVKSSGGVCVGQIAVFSVSWPISKGNLEVDSIHLLYHLMYKDNQEVDSSTQGNQEVDSRLWTPVDLIAVEMTREQ